MAEKMDAKEFAVALQRLNDVKNHLKRFGMKPVSVGGVAVDALPTVESVMRYALSQPEVFDFIASPCVHGDDGWCVTLTAPVGVVKITYPRPRKR